MRLIWATTARDDLVHIRRYIARFHSAAAGRVAARILASVELLPLQPELGTRTRLANIRRLIVPGTPYIVYYRLHTDVIEILEVFDGRREAPRSSGD
ncbi:type II toxin-antitoxin system RelE/ParE family toxin [Peteryoungia ipomoeae]|uniref:Type II toxin-antitoxin system RelE/ParE family toxin n=1 Tax=Peteryoungia ipomoeae TaxID=1210932 RepID=A0A4S8NYT8_9HYPH|nr:type II toxin-antitoxin system RelE/ParE family toxin [Peteryoungia ipomoeae]THV21522.1 type II toxin-antitoxin system RelE/ParE family toxin [Peteryoungia ipomoeae]